MEVRGLPAKNYRDWWHSDFGTTVRIESSGTLHDGTPSLPVSPRNIVKIAEKLVETFRTRGSTILLTIGEALGRTEGACLLHSWGEISQGQRVTQLRQCFQSIGSCGFSHHERVDFNERQSEVEVVFHLRVSERRIDAKIESLNIFLEGFYRGLTSIVLDRDVTSEFHGCGYDANRYKLTIHAKRPADQVKRVWIPHG